MSVAFRRGTTTGPSDLSITIRNTFGSLIDPYRLQYAVYDLTTSLEVLQGSPVNTPVRLSLGQYYAQVDIAGDANIGDWLIRWTIQETSTDPVYQTVQPFNVVGDSTITSFTGDINLDGLIMSLRILLRDANPDRNYHFRQPESEKFIQGQTQVFGFVWEDEELLEFIYMAIDDFNTKPPVTGILVSDIFPGAAMKRWRTAILLRAASFACFAIAMNWILDEFSVDGKEKITVKNEEAEYSLSMQELFDIIYGCQLKEIIDRAKKDIQKMKAQDNFVDKVQRPFSLFWYKIKKSIRNIFNNTQEKVLKESFFKGQLKVQSMVKGGIEPQWCPLSDVLRHHTPHKKMFKISTELGSVGVTEDHSLFHWGTKEPVKASDLKVGDLIVGLPGHLFEPIKVLGSELADPQKFTFDVSVPEAENAVLDSGILVHNSYSISGVSLDIEKSSKYQSMKDEFISEWDKSVEAAKRSIKIAVGLRQMRYGIGITSALGPISRPGVQSRRNMITPGGSSWS